MTTLQGRAIAFDIEEEQVGVGRDIAVGMSVSQPTTAQVHKVRGGEDCPMCRQAHLMHHANWTRAAECRGWRACCRAC